MGRKLHRLDLFRTFASFFALLFGLHKLVSDAKLHIFDIVLQDKTNGNEFNEPSKSSFSTVKTFNIQAILKPYEPILEPIELNQLSKNVKNFSIQATLNPYHEPVSESNLEIHRLQSELNTALSLIDELKQTGINDQKYYDDTIKELQNGLLTKNNDKIEFDDGLKVHYDTKLTELNQINVENEKLLNSTRLELLLLQTEKELSFQHVTDLDFEVHQLRGKLTLKEVEFAERLDASENRYQDLLLQYDVLENSKIPSTNVVDNENIVSTRNTNEIDDNWLYLLFGLLFILFGVIFSIICCCLPIKKDRDEAVGKVATQQDTIDELLKRIASLTSEISLLVSLLYVYIL